MRTSHRNGAVRTLLLALVLAGCAAAPNAEVDVAAEEQAIRDIVARWAEAADAGDAALFASFFAEDGIQMQPGVPPLMGRQAIQDAAQAVLPQADLSFAPDEVVVARSGDIAYERGTFRFSMETPGGPIADHGSYLVAWKKVNGEWKAAVDIFNSDLPAGPPAGDDQADASAGQ